MIVFYSAICPKIKDFAKLNISLHCSSDRPLTVKKNSDRPLPIQKKVIAPYREDKQRSPLTD
jgi:hypothetical protein